MKTKHIALGLLTTIFLSSFLAIGAITKTENTIKGKNEPEVSIPQISAATSILWEYNISGGSDMRSLTMTPNGFYLAFAYGDILYVFNNTQNVTMWTYQDSETIHAASFSADGSILAIGTSNWVRLFNMSLAIPNIPYWNYSISETAGDIEVSADGMYIFVAGGINPTSTLYFFNKTDDSAPMWSFDIGPSIGGIAMSADGEYMYAGSDDNNLYLLNKSYSGSKTEVWVFNNGADVKDVATSANGFYVILGGAAGSSAYLLTNNKNTLWTFTLTDQCDEVDISADGNYIILTTKPTSRSIYVFHKLSNVPLWSYQHATTNNYLANAAISANGCYIVAGSQVAASVYLFTKGSSTPLLHDSSINEVRSVAISADGKYFGSIDKHLTEHRFILFQNNDTSCTVDGGDGDPQDNPPSDIIPFGWYFLLISAISIIVIVMKQRRKLI